MQENDKFVAVPLHLFNKVLEYVGSKPYSEVNQIMMSLQQSAQVVELADILDEKESTDES